MTTAIAQTAVGLLAAIAMAVSGYFAQNVSAVSSRVDVLSSSQAATAQKATDIDTRLTRIEDKLDRIISKR